jgi:hypothetical protein
MDVTLVHKDEVVLKEWKIGVVSSHDTRQCAARACHMLASTTYQCASSPHDLSPVVVSHV